MAESIGIGSEIGGYRVTGLLGQGGMGWVYRAEELATGQERALKVLSERLTDAEDFRARFLRESRYAASVDHPNVVRVHDAGEDGGRLYMAMDYVQGTDLKALLALEGRLDTGRTLAILGDVAAALDAVHAAGLLHRDVKPGNVIVAPGPAGGEGSYLTDFGLSKNPAQDSRALTAAGDFVGTYYYTAPEQILANEPDHRADVYSLGCVLYECLTGEPPFRHEQAMDALHAHIEEPPPRVTERRPDLPAALDDVIAKAMAKQPRERFASCGELLAAARAAVAPAPVAGASPPELGVPREKLRLKVTAGNAGGTEIQVEDELLIGRAAEGQGTLAGDAEISRRHARIFRAQGGFMIEDLGSTNGTFVNGRELSAPELLSVADSIQLGGTTLRVQVSTPMTPPPTEAPAAPPPAPPGPAPFPRLSLRDVDLEAGEATLQLDEVGEPLRLVYEDGRWRVAPPA
jgi:tRNA A-37 threonylcarbamoyl transferase component Bud32